MQRDTSYKKQGTLQYLWQHGVFYMALLKRLYIITVIKGEMPHFS